MDGPVFWNGERIAIIITMNEHNCLRYKYQYPNAKFINRMSQNIHHNH